jgi:hypothetical protein
MLIHADPTITRHGFQGAREVACLRPVMSANSLIDDGLAVRITSSKAGFSSLKTCDSDRMEVNQILGSEALGLS